MSPPDRVGRPLVGPPWQAATKHGYPLDEVISALQKDIRRANADEALFWAHEANVSGYGAYVWRRLMVIASEDIGNANPQAAVLVHALWQHSNVLRDVLKARVPAADRPGLPWEPLFLLQAVQYLAMSDKCREMADAGSTIALRMDRNQLLPIPDYAKDKHTRAGRAMKRSEQHFQNEGRIVQPLVTVYGSPWAARWQAERDRADDE